MIISSFNPVRPSPNLLRPTWTPSSEAGLRPLRFTWRCSRVASADHGRLRFSPEQTQGDADARHSKHVLYDVLVVVRVFEPRRRRDGLGLGRYLLRSEERVRFGPLV